MSNRPWLRWGPWVGLALGLALAVSGVRLATTVAAPLPQVGTVPPTQVSPADPVTVGPPPPTGSAPRRVALPTLGVTAPVVAVLPSPDGQLGVPDRPSVLGWWSAGATPGSGRGTVVVDGHVDTRTAGAGALFHLADLRPGNPVLLTTAGGQTLRYTIRAVRGYAKQDLPAGLFTRTGAPRLVLITCGGPFDERTRHYADNVVAYATPQRRQ